MDLTRDIRLIACPSPLSVEKHRIDRLVPAGASIADHLRGLGWDPIGLHARVMIDGTLIDHAHWERVRPKAGHALTIRVIPYGGDNGKTALRIVGVLAVITAAVLTKGALAPTLGELGASIAATGLAAGATLALNGPIPPPLPRRALQIEGRIQ